MSQTWPTAELDQVRRLRVMAASTRGAAFAEALLAAPFAEVWAVAADLEGELPHLITDIHRARVTRSHGDRLELLASGRLGQRARFDVVLRPGWCWMQSRFLLGGMAAVPEAGGTRFAFLGGVRLPGAALLGPLLRIAGPPLGRVVLRRLERRVRQR